MSPRRRKIPVLSVHPSAASQRRYTGGKEGAQVKAVASLEG